MKCFDKTKDDMKEIEWTPYGVSYEAIKRKAEEYIHRILYGATFFNRYHHPMKPIIFISADILSIIGEGAEQALVYRCPREFTICGYEAKVVQDTNVLSFGFDLL